jgi:hypothetical protein
VSPHRVVQAAEVLPVVAAVAAEEVAVADGKNYQNHTTPLLIIVLIILSIQHKD